MTTSRPQASATAALQPAATALAADPAAGVFSRVPTHGRFDYSPINDRQPFSWPGGATLAVHVGLNIEGFAFGEGLGANLAPPSAQPDVLNYAWREYGNRVGVWRCLDLFDALDWHVGAIVNTVIFEQCPEVIAACIARGDEIIAHGHTNAERQGEWPEARERALIAACRDRIADATGSAPAGWLSPWISESRVTPDLLAEEGYAYTLNWCHDDQPVRMRTRGGRSLWSIPYPQELNDIPMIVARQMDAGAFAQIIVDQFDEMIEQSRRQPLVMGIALHPYLVGQPYRLRHLRRALQHVARASRDSGVWIATPGAICGHVESLQSRAAPAR